VASAREARALIVLDNCEHLIEAAARVAELITDRCPEVAIVATSREPLGVDGEQVVAVGPLAVPAANTAGTLGELLDNESVRLFVERAGAAREGFSLTDDNADAIASVCRRLDGIPLAIELAAARTQSMSTHSILERLDERFRLLAQRRRTALARHQTLRAAVDWSYDLLDPAEQRAFARLSVFAGGFTLDAAEAVIAVDPSEPLDVLDTLSGLVAKSMVLIDEHATVPYQLLETIREYAGERIEELSQPERVRHRHADYYVELAEQAAPHIVGRGDSIWSARLAAEHDNLHAALAWTRDHDPAKLTRLANGLAQFWFRRRHLQEGLGWIKAALDLDTQLSAPVRADLAGIAGFISINLSLVEQGHAFLRQSLDASRTVGDNPRPYTLMAFAIGALVTNRPGDARRYAEEALAGATAAQEPYTRADCLSNFSEMASLTGDPRGLELADQALDAARPLGNDYTLCIALQAGGIARYRTDPAAALALLDESIMVSSDTAFAIREQGLLFKGMALASEREYGQAAEAFEAALAYHHAAGAEYYQSMTLAAIAGLLARLGSASAGVQLLGSLERLRDDGRIVGAPRDLAIQEKLRDRLSRTIEPATFAEQWAAGRRLTPDDAVSLARAELSQVAF
jgi:predicted ATPase